MIDDVRYPIGPYVPADPPSAQELDALLNELAAAPQRLRDATSGLTAEQLATPYRPGGWTVAQVVHHLADAHLNWYLRTKFAVAESAPMVMPFDENTWVDLPDNDPHDIVLSLQMVEAVCAKWVVLQRALTPQQWKRTMVHPQRGEFVLDRLLGMQVWHSKHHTAHILNLRARKNW